MDETGDTDVRDLYSCVLDALRYRSVYTNSVHVHLVMLTGYPLSHFVNALSGNRTQRLSWSASLQSTKIKTLLR